jgi:hypothetical protein
MARELAAAKEEAIRARAGNVSERWMPTPPPPTPDPPSDSGPKLWTKLSQVVGPYGALKIHMLCVVFYSRLHGVTCSVRS